MPSIEEVFNSDDIPEYAALSALSKDIPGSFDLLEVLLKVRPSYSRYAVQTRRLALESLGEEAYSMMWNERNRRITTLEAYTEKHIDELLRRKGMEPQGTAEEKRKLMALNQIYRFMEEDGDRFEFTG